LTAVAQIVYPYGHDLRALRGSRRDLHDGRAGELCEACQKEVQQESQQTKPRPQASGGGNLITGLVR